MLTVVNSSHDPFYNQAFEEYVFLNFREGDVFLLWQNSPAVIVGCYQNICREVHVEGLRKLGIPVVRRMSGGGTVYHDLGNVNYTLISSQEGLIDYDRYLEPVIRALNAIGVPARKDRTCDIAVGDGKISGSAQKAAGGRVLHHGTLLFETDLSVLEQITTRHKNDCFQSKGTASAICPVTNIRRHLTNGMTLAQFRERLLEQILPAGSPRVSLTEEQVREVERLRDEKYRSWEWTWGKTPAFTYEKRGVFAGNPIRVAYQARHGLVSGAAVESPDIDGAQAARLLNGARLDPDGFSAVCRTLAGGRADELMDWLM
jgi:lipoate-protein ligase A